MTTRHGAHVAEAIVQTERPDRYLVQLCDHLVAMGPAQRKHGHVRPDHNATEDRTGSPPLVAKNVRRSSRVATIQFDEATCRLIIDGTALRMRLAADNPDKLRQMKTALAHRLEQIGRRDELTVTWTDQPTE